MNIKFACYNCGQKLEVDSTGLGMEIVCPSCGAKLIVANIDKPSPIPPQKTPLIPSPATVIPAPRFQPKNSNKPKSKAVLIFCSLLVATFVMVLLLAQNYRDAQNAQKTWDNACLALRNHQWTEGVYYCHKLLTEYPENAHSISLKNLLGSSPLNETTMKSFFLYSVSLDAADHTASTTNLVYAMILLSEVPENVLLDEKKTIYEDLKRAYSDGRMTTTQKEAIKTILGKNFPN